jgi:hypothetical protein
MSGFFRAVGEMFQRAGDDGSGRANPKYIRALDTEGALVIYFSAGRGILAALPHTNLARFGQSLMQVSDKSILIYHDSVRLTTPLPGFNIALMNDDELYAPQNSPQFQEEESYFAWAERYGGIQEVNSALEREEGDEGMEHFDPESGTGHVSSSDHEHVEVQTPHPIPISSVDAYVLMHMNQYRAMLLADIEKENESFSSADSADLATISSPSAMAGADVESGGGTGDPIKKALREASTNRKGGKSNEISKADIDRMLNDEEVRVRKALDKAEFQRSINRAISSHGVQLITPWKKEFVYRITDEDSPYMIFDMILVNMYELWKSSSITQLFIINGIERFLHAKESLVGMWGLDILEGYLVCNMQREYEDIFSVDSEFQQMVLAQSAAVQMKLDQEEKQERMIRDGIPLSEMMNDHDMVIAGDMAYGSGLGSSVTPGEVTVNDIFEQYAENVDVELRLIREYCMKKEGLYVVDEPSKSIFLNEECHPTQRTGAEVSTREGLPPPPPAEGGGGDRPSLPKTLPHESSPKIHATAEGLSVQIPSYSEYPLLGNLSTLISYIQEEKRLRSTAGSRRTSPTTNSHPYSLPSATDPRRIPSFERGDRSSFLKPGDDSHVERMFRKENGSIVKRIENSAVEGTLKAVKNAHAQCLPNWTKYHQATKMLLVEVQDMLRECDAYEEAYNKKTYRTMDEERRMKESMKKEVHVSTDKGKEKAIPIDGVESEEEPPLTAESIPLMKDGFFYCPYRCGKEKPYDPDFPHIPHARRGRMWMYIKTIEESLTEIVDNFSF